MSRQTKGFDRAAVVFGDLREARARLAEADGAVRARMERALPPEPMASAPAAPARGPMQLQPNFEVTRGGIRREAGAHWRGVCQLVAMNAHAAARAEAREVAAVLPFNAGQIGIAETYRALVEWREGSALKCASLEAGRSGGGGSGLFIDAFIDRGAVLEALRARVGNGYAMRPQRHMDRGNARRAITDRALLDMVVVAGLDLSEVLRRFGWQADGRGRRALRDALCAVLDRMQGYRDARHQDMA